MEKKTMTISKLWITASSTLPNMKANKGRTHLGGERIILIFHKEHQEEQA